MNNEHYKTLSAICVRKADFTLCILAGMKASIFAALHTAVIVTLFWVAPVAAAADQPAHSFPDTSLESWLEKSFVGNTKYELIPVADQSILKASTNKTASLLYKEKTIDLQDTPWIEWTWKVDSVYQNIDERSKSGDDFPARFYVAVKTGLLPWDTIGINYVWSSTQTTGTTWNSPFTEKSIMLAVQSGDEMTGQWVTQRRNIVEDFKQLFNIDVTQISGYAVMVDGDNSGQKSTAYFGKIDFNNRQ